MTDPLGAAIEELQSAAGKLARSADGARAAWNDSVFRATEQRSILRLQSESRTALTALASANNDLRRALTLIGR